MAARINLLKESKPPAPHEKVLRAPSFSQKYSWLKWGLMLIILVAAIDFGIIKVLNTNNNNSVPVQNNSSVTPLPTVDPTQSWNVYTSSMGKYTFKYPDGYIVTESQNTVKLASNKLPNNSEFVLTISFKPAVGETELQTLITKNPYCPKLISQKPTISTINGQQPAQLYADTACGNKPTSIIYTINNDMFYTMAIQSDAPFMNIKPYTDQILATLSFSAMDHPMDSNQQTFCTQDAMQCSDGSWVGRTGPNCEFVCPARR